MNTCNKCRYWNPYHKDDPVASIGQCENKIMRQFIYPTMHSPNNDVPKEVPVYGFDTFPNFACVLWEKKDE